MILLKCILVTIFAVHGIETQVNQPPTCDQDILDRSFVTQCNPSVCEPVLEKEDGKDERSSEWPKTKDEVVHIVSSREGDRFIVNTYNATDRTDYYYEDSHSNGTMFVEPNSKYQRILGFGTTLTDASCKNTDDLPEEIRSKLINDYFNPEEGIGLNLIKVPIGSTKYSFTNYVLDQPDDTHVDLSSYDIEHRIPLIRDAIKSAGKLKSRVKILASSLSAPPELKSNNRIIHGGSLKGDKVKEYAVYLNSFIAAYRLNDIKIWSLLLTESPVTIGRDQGLNDTIDYNSMVMRPSDTIKLVEEIGKLRDKRSDVDSYRLLMLGDDRAHIPVWADGVLSSNIANKYIAGIAYDCNRDNLASYDNLVYVTRRYPSKYLLATQGSQNSPVKLGNWQFAENYVTEIIKNLEYGSVGWIDFNMALNLDGGPVINERFKADAPVMVDPRRGAYYRNPMFYAIGHLSRYVKPGSVRVKVAFYSAPHMYASQQIAFVTPDNYLVVVISNNNVHPMVVRLGIEKTTKTEVILKAKSFNTFVMRL